jgi:hypothetical protein
VVANASGCTSDAHARHDTDATTTPLRRGAGALRFRLPMRSGTPRFRMGCGIARPASSSVVSRRGGLSGLSRRRSRVRVPSLALDGLQTFASRRPQSRTGKALSAPCVLVLLGFRNRARATASLDCVARAVDVMGDVVVRKNAGPRGGESARDCKTDPGASTHARDQGRSPAQRERMACAAADHGSRIPAEPSQTRATPVQRDPRESVRRRAITRPPNNEHQPVRLGSGYARMRGTATARGEFGAIAHRQVAACLYWSH